MMATEPEESPLVVDSEGSDSPVKVNLGKEEVDPDDRDDEEEEEEEQEESDLMTQRMDSMPEELKKLLKHTHNFGVKQSHQFSKMASPQRRRHGRSDERAEIIEDKQLVEDEDEADIGVQLRFDVQPPVIKGGEMRSYQIKALNWLISLHEDSTLNGILADEMGLGKTLETISLFGYLKHYRNVKTPSLIAVPLGVLSGWCREFEKWCPTIKFLRFHGSKEERVALKEKFDCGEYDICLTSYELVNIEISYFKKKKWYYMVIDEGHRIKNADSLLSKNVRKLSTEHRLLLTGTPIQNNLRELWGLLNFLAPQYFLNCDNFEEWFKIENVKDSDVIIKQLHMILRPFLLRRLKKHVEKDLPAKAETCIYTGLTKLQKKIYSSALAKDIAILNGQGQRNSVLNLVMQLRKCCNHPYLFHGVEPGPPFEEGEHIVDACGKMVLLDKLLKRLKAKGDRVLIFSQMTRMLDILEDFMILRRYKYQRLDGSTSPLERLERMDQFNAEESEDFVFLLSTRAGGLGINLQSANVVILFDSDWNPQMDLQAIDRAHRIGQTKTVHVYRLVTDGTVEEHMIERAMKKLFLDAVVIQQGRLAQQHKTASFQQLCAMVRFGAEKIFKSQAGTITEEDIDTILKQGEQRTKEQQEKLKENCDYNLLEFTFDDDESKSMYDYEDGKYANSKKKPSVSSFISLPTRNRGTVDYSESAYFRKMIVASAPKPSGPKIFKPKERPDYQFFNNKRLVQLQKKDFDARAKFKVLKEANRIEKQHQKLEERRAESNGASSSSSSSSSSSEPPKKKRKIVEKSEEDLKEDAGWLTAKEVRFQDKLLAAGFADWNFRDVCAYINACATHGRRHIKSISTAVEGKTPSEVRRYHKIFWERHEELERNDQWMKRIENGEADLKRTKKYQKTLDKVLNVKDPFETLQIPNKYNSTDMKFNIEEDRFILCEIHRLGWGEWDQLKKSFRKHPMFRFDWFIKSRTPKDLELRCKVTLRNYESAFAKRKKAKAPSSKAKAKAKASNSKAKTSKPKSSKSKTSTNGKKSDKGPKKHLKKSSKSKNKKRKSPPTAAVNSNGSAKHKTKKSKLK